MSYYLNFRANAVGGPVIDPYLLQGDGTANPPLLRSVDWSALDAIVSGKNVLFGVHGFNVSYEQGACSLGRLEPHLGMGPSEVFFGVLWPGDFWIPVINYPFEGDVAIDCGRRLAIFCRRWLSKAQSISFLSHSLGARLVLEAVENLERKTRSICLTAAAVNRDCLSTEYATATANSSAVSILASHNDLPLRIAFPVADAMSDVFHYDHSPFQPALGYGGPPSPALPPIIPPWQIPDAADYGHHDYLPPGDSTQNDPESEGQKWLLPAGFMARAFHGQTQSWP